MLEIRANYSITILGSINYLSQPFDCYYLANRVKCAEGGILQLDLP